jgi:enoyl-CoA hydratase/carnithine racemase
MVDVTMADGIAEIALSTEPCNEIGEPMLDALERVIDGLDVASTRAVILHSTVRRGFSAGADLRALYDGMLTIADEDQMARISAFIDRIHALFDRIDQLPMTTIAAVHGVCFGGGFELALTADIIVAERTARFAFPELRLGLIPGFGGIPRLERDVGGAVVRDLLLTGRSYNAAKAVSVGLASQQVGRGEGLEVARAIARQATRFEPTVQAEGKAFCKPLPRARLDAEKAQFLRMIQRPIVREALRRFVHDDGPMPWLPAEP